MSCPLLCERALGHRSNHHWCGSGLLPFYGLGAGESVFTVRPVVDRLWR